MEFFNTTTRQRRSWKAKLERKRMMSLVLEAMWKTTPNNNRGRAGRSYLVLKILGSYCTSLDKELSLPSTVLSHESCSFGTIGARDRTQVTPKFTTVSYGGLKEGNGDVTMTGIISLLMEMRVFRTNILRQE
eukprot:scaffold4071_cov136-Skeletonema_marinoi.AAC.3